MQINRCQIEKQDKHLLIKNDNNQIIGSLCKWCFATTQLNPFRNCKDGVSVSTLCYFCLKDYCIILDYIYNKQGYDSEHEKMAIKIANVNIDWNDFEIRVNNKFKNISLYLQAKYKLSRKEIKYAIVQQFGDKIEFNNTKFWVNFKKDITMDTNTITNMAINSVSACCPTNCDCSTESTSSPPIDVDKLSSLITNQRTPIKVLSAKFGTTDAEMKKFLQTTFGARVKFLRGRKGGVSLT